MSFVTSLCRPLGYELAILDLSNPPVRQDAILVRADLLPERLKTMESDRDAFLRQPAIRAGFHDLGVDSREWRGIEDWQALRAAVDDALRAASVARSKAILPYHLSVADEGLPIPEAAGYSAASWRACSSSPRKPPDWRCHSAA